MDLPQRILFSNSSSNPGMESPINYNPCPPPKAPRKLRNTATRPNVNFPIYAPPNPLRVTAHNDNLTGPATPDLPQRLQPSALCHTPRHYENLSMLMIFPGSTQSQRLATWLSALYQHPLASQATTHYPGSFMTL